MKYLTKKEVWKKLESPIVNPHCGKYLSGEGKRKCYVYMRDRKEQTTYYSIVIKGNYIRAYKINYVNAEGNSVNTYMSVFVPALIGNEVKIPVTKKTLIAKRKFKEYAKFLIEFKEQSESLAWDDSL